MTYIFWYPCGRNFRKDTFLTNKLCFMLFCSANQRLTGYFLFQKLNLVLEKVLEIWWISEVNLSISSQSFVLVLSYFVLESGIFAFFTFLRYLNLFLVIESNVVLQKLKVLLFQFLVTHMEILEIMSSITKKFSPIWCSRLQVLHT